MTKESELADLLRADATLMAILTGGVFTDEEVGIEGIRRGEDDSADDRYSPTATAFDEEGYLKPCALVRELGEIPVARTQTSDSTGLSQMVQIYFYQDRDSDQIEAARLRAWDVLNGQRLGRSYPIWCDSNTARVYDVGPVANAKTVRQDWRVVFTR